VHLDLLFLPDPHLAHAEPPVDLELVESAAGPDHLDGEIRSIPALIADEVALVRLHAAFLRSFLERPATVGGKVDPRSSA
jgi:hypothetical protein